MAPDARSSRAASGLRCVSGGKIDNLCADGLHVGGRVIYNKMKETHPFGIGIALTPAVNRTTVESLILTPDARFDSLGW